MIRASYYLNNGESHTHLEPEQFAKALGDPSGLLWVDFEGEDPQDCEPILRDIFQFHYLAVDDALRESHVPKVDDWESYLYIVLHDITYQRGEADIETPELDIFLGNNYLVTHHDLHIPALERVWGDYNENTRHLKKGVDHLLYRLTDELTVDYMSAVEVLDEEIDWVEDEVFTKPHTSMVQRVFALKRASLHLRRTLSPLREVLNKLARDDYAVIDARDQVYFRDVYDHLVRLHDISESLRDLVGGVLDTYLSVINNRMNEVMKTLTIITTLFMPLSFIAGFFGMNFFLPHDPVYSFMEKPIFALVLLVLMITPIGMYAWMRKRKWM
ncbi:MAG: magnesium/cobalt transporter CorA [Anaerolineales bacterium]|nr:magnesium/cobalt transporter CorA [Anaerolineales bacterium]